MRHQHAVSWLAAEATSDCGEPRRAQRKIGSEENDAHSAGNRPDRGRQGPAFGSKNFLSGLFFLGVGALGIFMARGYPMGTALRMGPGYFPIVLSGMLILFGIYCLLQGLLKPEKLPGSWSLRALLILPTATVVFGVLMEHAGFIPALIGLVFISAYAGSEFRFTEVVLMAIGLTVGSWALFIWGLGLPYPLFVGH